MRVHTVSGEEHIKFVCLLCVLGGGVHPRGFVPQALIFPSVCVIDMLLCLSVFVHLCVSMWSCVNGISVAFCVFYLAACGGVRRVCGRACCCVRVCACACLQEEWGRRGALAAQASPSVSLPPLAPSALAEIVTRRQTANGRQTATPRETWTIVNRAQTPPVGEKPAWSQRADRQTALPSQSLL